ncbi:nitrous oxide reductase accessory protein NosL [Haladaptatus sp. F3-133]|uniref:Nitrous oxide reductase accessory protein NosL n=1 Tax=Halorutilus salinus TaxID=2487751 RepID=A0A9Q4C2H2_9EURY|nr:nitrous oxide reductase accessory protein NosL [Halorutilus salinus]
MYRRRFIAGLAVTAVGSTGCLGGNSSEDVPDPIALSGEKFDDQGGMAIGDHGGPNGQVFYAENSPEGHENPAWFHTLVFGLFPYHFDRLDRGWEAEAVYVTDYSKVDLPSSSDGNPRLPAPTAADTFADATEVTYVAESEAVGGMGPALPPFSEESEAEDFAERYGGRTIGFEGITSTLIEELKRNAPGGMGMNGMNMSDG